MIFRVYKITSPNGLVYIGCTRRSLRQRFSGSYNQRLTEDFEKYGKNNFKIECLNEIKDNSLLAKRMESIAIKKYQSTDPKKGYNIEKESDYPFLSVEDMANKIPIVVDCISQEEADMITDFHKRYVSSFDIKQQLPQLDIKIKPTVSTNLSQDPRDNTLRDHPGVGISVNAFLGAQTQTTKARMQDDTNRDNDEWVFDGQSLPLDIIHEVFDNDFTEDLRYMIINSYKKLGYKYGEIMSKKALRERLKEVKAKCEFGV